MPVTKTLQMRRWDWLIYKARNLARRANAISSVLMYRKARSLISRFPQETAKLKGRSFVFNTIWTVHYSLHLNTDLFLARCLADAGATVYVLLDDGLLEHWDRIRVSELRARNGHSRIQLSGLTINDAPGRVRRYHRSRVRAILGAYRHPRIHVSWYSKIISDSSVLSDIELTDSDVDNAERSVVRFFETGYVDSNDPLQQRYLELSLHNCRVSRAVGNYIVEKLNPHCLITWHGFYSCWGGCHDTVAEAGIPVRVIEEHPYRNGFLDIREGNTDIANQPEYRQFRVAPLPERAREQAVQTLKNRISLADDRVTVYFGRFKGRFQSLKVTRRGPAQVVFTAFPNVAWDVYSAPIDSQFDSMIDWLVKTVQVIRESGHHLVIRFHPSETSELEGARPLREILTERIPEVDELDGLTLVDSDQSINTYELAKDVTDIGLVFNGTLGHELPFLGVPVIAASQGRFPGEAVYYPNSIEEYYEWLRFPSSILNDFARTKRRRIEESLKYVAYAYYHNCYDLPPLLGTGGSSFDYSVPVSEQSVRALQRRLSMPKGAELAEAVR